MMVVLITPFVPTDDWVSRVSCGFQPLLSLSMERVNHGTIVCPLTLRQDRKTIDPVIARKIARISQLQRSQFRIMSLTVRQDPLVAPSSASKGCYGYMRPTQAIEVQQNALRVLELVEFFAVLIPYFFNPEGCGDANRVSIGTASWRSTLADQEGDIVGTAPHIGY